MEFHFEGRDGYFRGVTSGDAELGQYAELLDAMLTHNQWEPGSPWMHDHSGLNAGPLTVDDIQQVAEFCYTRRAQLEAGKCAIVVSRDLEFGLSRMWSAYVSEKWDVEADVFRSREEAAGWLLVERRRRTDI